MPSLQEALDTFLLIERRPQTNRQYEITLGCLIRAIGPDNDVSLISYEILLNYQARLRKTVKPSTLRGYTNIYKAFFKWCQSRKYTEVNPAADLLLPRKNGEPAASRAIPAAELRRMVEYARVTSVRNYALLLFLCDTGCRVGGLVSLTVLHLHLDEGFAFIEEKSGKWVRVMFGEETANALGAWLRKRPACQHDYVWTGKAPAYAPIKRAAVEALFRVLSEKTDASQVWGPHNVRHAVGHAWAKAGMPPHITKEKLNHQHVSTTLNFYYPQQDPYVEVASRHLSLASLKDDDDQRSQGVILLDRTPRRAIR